MKQTIQKLLVVTAMLSAGITAFAYDFEVDDIYYNILSEEERTVEVTRYNNWSPSYSGDIIIPERIIYNSTTYKVVSIGDNAFENCGGLTSVTIGNNVTTIGNSAFLNCDGLTSVTIGNSVTTIGEDAFKYCDGLTSVTIGNSVTTIGWDAFSNCTGLTTVTIPNSVTTIGWGAFSNCTGLTTVTIPNSVMTIGDNAFFNCTSLTSVTIGNSVTTIGNKAFSDCTGLTTITIPNSVTTIKELAFSNCTGLIEINVDDNNKKYSSIDGVLYNKDVSELICYPCGMPLNSFSIPNSVTKIGNSAFYGCDGLTSVTIPNSVTTIGEDAFGDCDGLTSVKIPNSVTTIEGYAFWYCDGLTSVTIGNSVTTIGVSAFSSCKGLTSVMIGNSVTTIGEDVFSGCGNIKEIYCQPVIPPSADNQFTDEVLMNATLYVPIGSKKEYEQVDPWRNFWNIEEYDFAGVEDVVGSDVDVTAENGRIIVTSAEEGTRIEVYSVAGQLIYSGTDTTINAPSAGLYIVRVAGEAFKVMLQ